MAHTVTELPSWLSADAVGAELARRSMEDFVHRMRGESYLMGWFHRELCQELDAFLAAVERGESPRLIIEAPPRHGKSELASRLLPAYALGRNPDLEIIASSYSGDLASAMNRDVQRIIDSQEYPFLGTRLWGSSSRSAVGGSYLRNSDVFEVVGTGGSYKSSGVGGGITGHGMRLGIVDDPIKDAEEAHSQTVRDKVWDWFTSTFYTRLAPGGGILIIMTRWHQDDLVGRVLAQAKEDGEQWRVLRYPAIAEQDEKHRKEGEALHPERFDEKTLERIRKAVGSRVWASLYQQRPAAAEGDIFKREYWNYLRPPQDLITMTYAERSAWLRQQGFSFLVQGWDTALGTKKRNDYTACTTLGVGPNRYGVLDVWRGKIEFPDVLKQVELQYDAWKPNQVAVEGGGSASGKALVQMLSRSTRIPFHEVASVADKVFRAETLSPLVESRLVTIVEGGGWQSTFIDQCANFPNVPKDDDVDSFMIALEAARTRSAASRISDELLKKVGVRR